MGRKGYICVPSWATDSSLRMRLEAVVISLVRLGRHLVSAEFIDVMFYTHKVLAVESLGFLVFLPIDLNQLKWINEKTATRMSGKKR